MPQKKEDVGRGRSKFEIDEFAREGRLFRWEFMWGFDD